MEGNVRGATRLQARFWLFFPKIRFGFGAEYPGVNAHRALVPPQLSQFPTEIPQPESKGFFLMDLLILGILGEKHRDQSGDIFLH